MVQKIENVRTESGIFVINQRRIKDPGTHRRRSFLRKKKLRALKS